MKIRRFIFKSIKITVIVFFLIMGCCFLYIKLSPKITINSANNIVLYDKDKNIFFKGSEKKEWVELKDISRELVDCTIYTEDKNFYHHFGFDFLRIGKAMITNMKNKSMVEGALLLPNNTLRICF